MTSHIAALLNTIKILRAPGGCPWDRKQTLPDAAHYLLDEAGELLEAALAGDVENIAEELADLLFMTCFCCEILSETNPVNFEYLARLGNEKLIRRHPHVFEDKRAHSTTESQERWNAIKAQEKQERGDAQNAPLLLKDLPASSAPLHQAFTYQQDAARVGFDWPDTEGVWEKIAEEISELRAATAEGDPVAMEAETGDLLFAVTNLARHLGVQPDIALRHANRRFRNRFEDMAKQFDQSAEKMREASLAELEAAWQEAKTRNEF